ncbi:hypothetical protein ZHAS_00017695 [Anopheles sinensis]|uniref:Uncharacterized protein n=1 Tax=Anopheles sinensis TaxID=74873 RepID=A0A084WGZ9_ANOSI|nr:hypothetical protein ZHAS_00017695 [Anopheles sinensis]
MPGRDFCIVISEPFCGNDRFKDSEGFFETSERKPGNALGDRLAANGTQSSPNLKRNPQQTSPKRCRPEDLKRRGLKLLLRKSA